MMCSNVVAGGGKVAHEQIFVVQMSPFLCRWSPLVFSAGVPPQCFSRNQLCGTPVHSCMAWSGRKNILYKRTRLRLLQADCVTHCSTYYIWHSQYLVNMIQSIIVGVLLLALVCRVCFLVLTSLTLKVGISALLVAGLQIAGGPGCWS